MSRRMCSFRRMCSYRESWDLDTTRHTLIAILLSTHSYSCASTHIHTHPTRIPYASPHIRRRISCRRCRWMSSWRWCAMLAIDLVLPYTHTIHSLHTLYRCAMLACWGGCHTKSN
jgi:hypothetical protein